MKKNILNRILFVLFIITFMMLLMTLTSHAATSITISTSKSTVSPGESFTVTVSAVGAGPVTTSVSNGSGGKNEFLDNSSYSFTCTAGSSGSVTISASGTLGDYETNGEQSRSASKTVKIASNSNSSGSSSSSKPNTSSNTNNQPTPKSTDNSLKGLSVEEGAISPEFNKDVREYTLAVPNEIGGANVTAIPNDSKATVSVTGNVGLQEGENTVTILVTAEDGSTSKYLIRVTRARPALSLQSLVIKYNNQEGQLIEVPLNPIFNFETYEYNIEDLEYWVEKLEIEAMANIEGATIDIQGADGLVQGENIITITVKIPMETNEELAEGEEPQGEIKTYTIKFNRKEEPAPPTLMGRIKNWFNGIFGGVTTWYNGNQEKVILGALGVCVVALLGLSIYIVIDYKKYKLILEKVRTLNNMNINDKILENASQYSTDNIKEQNEIIEDINTDNTQNEDKKGGKHF